MVPTPHDPEPLYSRLAEDADLGDIVELFVQELPDRVSNVLDRLDAADREGLRRLAHQLKGAAGSHGFDPISQAAARVEDAIRASQPEAEIRRFVQVLVELCRRARTGAPGGPAEMD